MKWAICEIRKLSSAVDYVVIGVWFVVEKCDESAANITGLVDRSQITARAEFIDMLYA